MDDDEFEIDTVFAGPEPECECCAMPIHLCDNNQGSNP